MAIFSITFFKILSALLSVLIGFLAGKFADVKKDGIATLLFYFIVPIVFFTITASAPLKISDLSITLLTFSIASLLSCFAYFSYGKFWNASRTNILTYSAGTGNAGYLGIPIASMLFDEHILSIFVLATIGIAIYEVITGFYFCARSQVSISESIIKIIKLPSLIGFFLGCLVGISDYELSSFLDSFVHDIKGVFAVLGMVLIGLALSGIDEFKLNYKFMGATFFSKFIMYPLAFNLFIIVDKFFLGWYSADYHNALQLACIMPLATSTIIMSSLFDLHPEEMASSVVAALLFSLIYIPAMSSFLLVG